MDKVIEEALCAIAESSSIEFKETFDPKSPQGWCEIVKDIVAMANSAGGVIVFGLDSEGNPSGLDVHPIATLDPSEFTNKIYRYTGYQFAEFLIVPCEKSGHKLIAFRMFELPLPLVFEKPGTYEIGQGKQRTAFSSGTVYFRHGAKSEPGNSDDLRSAFERRLGSVREEWLTNLRQVIEAPFGSKIITIQPETDMTDLPIRITDDPTAPAIGGLNPDRTHPYRQKELMEAVNEQLPTNVRINQYDIQCIKKIHNIDGNPSFHCLRKFGGHQYSQAFADWIVTKFHEDNDFFHKTRQRGYELRTSLGKGGHS